MTDGMTVPPVILVQPTCPGDQRARGELFLLTCNLCQESHKSQVWLCFLILSFLSTSTYALSGRDLTNFQICLDRIKPSIEKSDAVLYTPSANHVEKNCKKMSLKCYILELMMVIEEEEISGKNVNCIIDFNDILPTEVSNVGCPPCEAYSLRNTTVFIKSLSLLIKELTVLENTYKT